MIKKKKRKPSILSQSIKIFILARLRALVQLIQEVRYNLNEMTWFLNSNNKNIYTIHLHTIREVNSNIQISTIYEQNKILFDILIHMI